jgi:hypothetical protein
MRAWGKLYRDSMLAPFGLAHSTAPADGQLKGAPQIPIKPAHGRFEVGPAHPEVFGYDTVESSGPTSEGMHAMGADVVADRTNGLHSRRDIQVRSGNGGSVVEPLPGREPAAQVDHREHAEILRRQCQAPRDLSQRASAHWLIWSPNVPAQGGSMFPGFGTIVNVATVIAGSAVVLLVGAGLRLLHLRLIPVGDLLPALVVAPLLAQIVALAR